MASWSVVHVAEFEVWLDAQSDALREALMAYVIALADQGPHLSRPYCDTLSGSGMSNLKELRIQVKGEPYRVLFAFDAQRRAVLLLGGNKRGDKRWYEKHIPIARARFEAWQETAGRSPNDRKDN